MGKAMNLKISLYAIIILVISPIITNIVWAYGDKKMKTRINEQPKELGKVSWYRDYEEAIAESERTGKPVFLLFQEVPGCSNCIHFGHDLLSYPLFVEAIENEFVPLAIYNNVGGADKVIIGEI